MNKRFPELFDRAGVKGEFLYEALGFLGGEVFNESLDEAFCCFRGWTFVQRDAVLVVRVFDKYTDIVADINEDFFLKARQGLVVVWLMSQSAFEGF